MDDLYFVMQRRLKDGFTLPLAQFDSLKKAEEYIKLEQQENTIPNGYEEYVEHRQLKKNLQFEL